MALDTQIVSIPLAQGVDTETDEFQVPIGKLLKLENAIFTHPGKLVKRKGFSKMTRASTNGNITAGAAVSAYNEELLLFTGSDVLSYSPAATQWSNKGFATSVSTTVQSVVRNNDAQIEADGYIMGNFQVIAYQDSHFSDADDAIYYDVIDISNNSTLVHHKLISSANSYAPKVIAFQGKFMIIFYNGGVLRYVTIDPAAPYSVGISSILVDDVDVSYQDWDVGVYTNHLYLAYRKADDFSPGLYVNAYTDFGALEHSEYMGNIGHNAITLFPDVKSNHWVVCAGTGGIDVIAIDSGNGVFATAHVSDTTNVAHVLGFSDPTDNNSVVVMWEVIDSWHYIQRNTVNMLGHVNPLNESTYMRSVGLYGKAFKQEARYYIPLAFETNFQSSYFLADDRGNIISRNNYRLGYGLRTSFHLVETPSVSANVFNYPILTKERLVSQDNVVFSETGVSTLTVDFTNPHNFLSATMGNCLHVVGGVAQTYDGISLVEDNFLVYPEPIGIDEQVSEGATPAGNYQYQVTYEWTDNLGQIQRSTPSEIQSWTADGSGAVFLTIPTLRLTNKTLESPVRIVIYRTESDGSIFYRITSITTPLINDPTVDTVTYQDLSADADIISHDAIYTTGGILENAAPPASRLITQCKDRLFISGLEDPNLLWFSKHTVNGAPVEFSEFLTMRCDPRGGAITGLAVMDNNLVIFKETAIFLVVGDGPTDTGDFNDYGDPQFINTGNIGCIEPNSIVITPNGLMFKSHLGIYLFNRGDAVQYIGNAVDAYNDLEITSATQLTNAKQIRFTTDSDKILVYDYYNQQWTTFTNLSAVDSDVWNGTYVILGSDGTVTLETEDETDDDGTFITMTIQTNWMDPSQLQGFKRVKNVMVLGRRLGEHILNVTLDYDFAEILTEVHSKDLTWTSVYGNRVPFVSPPLVPYGSDPVYGGDPYQAYQWKIKPNNQKCQSIRITINDSRSSAINRDNAHSQLEAFEISNIALEIGLKRGLMKLPADNTI